ncbi:hypothetical protein [Acinetobacter sp. YH12239]|uniref:hypothetical protein n=1 Tax=Acinetobacter sp. YH12239 TaxID=2601166 RepID=UPI0015D22B90|nr:hypothetical protein [Acinetobacter sp. YH12239]
MSEFFLNTRFFKRLPSSSSDIQSQLNTLKEIVKKIVVIDPIFSTWYINNPTGKNPPLDHPFPSEKADNFLITLKEKDPFQSISLWNGEDNSNFGSINFDTFDFRMNFEKIMTYEQVVEILKVLLEHIQFKYMYLSNNFFSEINVYPHRLVTTSICYVSKTIDIDSIPHLYKNIEIDNDLNKGNILVFDKNWTSESDEMKRKVQENSLALVELGVIPEAELPEDFFEQ